MIFLISNYRPCESQGTKNVYLKRFFKSNLAHNDLIIAHVLVATLLIIGSLSS